MSKKLWEASETKKKIPIYINMKHSYPKNIRINLIKIIQKF